MKKIKKKHKSIFNIVLETMGEEKNKMFLFIFLTMLMVIFNLLTNFVNKIFLDSLKNDKPSMFIDKALVKMLGGFDNLHKNLWLAAIVAIAFGLSSCFINIIRRKLEGSINAKVGYRNQLDLFNKVQRLPYSTLKKMKNGDILQTVTRDEETLRRFVARDMTRSLFYTVFMVLFSFIILAFINIKIALSSIALLPFLFIYNFFGIKEVRRRYDYVDESEAEITAKIEENIQAIRVVKAYNNEQYEINDFDNYLKDYKSKFFFYRKRCAVFFTICDIICFSQIALTTIIGIILCSMGDISIGTLSISIQFSGMLVWPIRNLSSVLSNMAQAITSYARMERIRSEELEDIDSGITPNLDGDIEFKNVKFKYDDGTNFVLDGVSFKIKKGETIAIMGKTGSGKSTIVNLLSALFPYTEGSITINNYELKDIQKKHLREHVGLVLQEPFLFSKTIASNLKIVNPDITEEEMFNSIKIASLDQTINDLKDGLNTYVGERGVSLSGGQKQRISIARTLVTKAPVLIFDDSLSAVDTETDIKIRQALKQRAKDKTTIIVTHRVSTAKDADHIIILENGKVSEFGTHQELVNKPGLYQRIYEIQNRIVWGDLC